MIRIIFCLAVLLSSVQMVRSATLTFTASARPEFNINRTFGPSDLNFPTVEFFGPSPCLDVQLDGPGNATFTCSVGAVVTGQSATTTFGVEYALDRAAFIRADLGPDEQEFIVRGTVQLDITVGPSTDGLTFKPVGPGTPPSRFNFLSRTASLSNANIIDGFGLKGLASDLNPFQTEGDGRFSLGPRASPVLLKFDFTFTGEIVEPSPVAAVPLPASGLMFLGALSLAGCAARRRNKFSFIQR